MVCTNRSSNALHSAIGTLSDGCTQISDPNNALNHVVAAGAVAANSDAEHV